MKITFQICFLLTRLNSYVISIRTRGCSSDGRALEWHSRGRRFDPAQLHQINGYKGRVLQGFFHKKPLLLK